MKLKTISFDINSSFQSVDKKISLLEMKTFYYLLLLVVIISDILLFQNGSSSMSRVTIDNIIFEPGSIPKGLIQPLKLISITKYPFFIFLFFYNSKLNISLNKYIIVLFGYLVLNGFLLQSKYFIVFPILLLLYCYKELLKKHILKCIFLSFIFLLILPILSPIIHSLRGEKVSFTHYSEPIDNSGKSYHTTDPLTKIKYVILNKLYIQETKGNHGIKKIFFVFFDNTLSIMSKRLNYLQINAKIIEHVENNETEDNNYFNNNFISIVPRLIWPSKPIITNNSDLIANKVHISPHSIKRQDMFAVGFRPIGESFLVFGWNGLFFAILVGTFFYLVNLILINNVYSNSFYIYYSFELIKHDTFHAVIPGFIHLLIALLFFYTLSVFSKKTVLYSSKYKFRFF
tara:strand:- start:185 stop:1387 length:1203 start_codon:yes stop_codon:yes gene_type:complete